MNKILYILLLIWCFVFQSYASNDYQYLNRAQKSDLALIEGFRQKLAVLDSSLISSAVSEEIGKNGDSNKFNKQVDKLHAHIANAGHLGAELAKNELKTEYSTFNITPKADDENHYKNFTKDLTAVLFQMKGCNFSIGSVINGSLMLYSNLKNSAINNKTLGTYYSNIALPTNYIAICFSFSNGDLIIKSIYPISPTSNNLNRSSIKNVEIGERKSYWDDDRILPPDLQKNDLKNKLNSLYGKIDVLPETKVQELQKQVNDLKTENQNLKNQLNVLQQMQQGMQNLQNNMVTKADMSIKIDQSSLEMKRQIGEIQKNLNSSQSETNNSIVNLTEQLQQIITKPKERGICSKVAKCLCCERTNKAHPDVSQTQTIPLQKKYE